MKKISLPEKPLAENKEDFVRSVMLESQTAEIFSKLAQYNLDLIPLKGIWFSKILYSDPSHRHVSDLDILIKAGDFDKADKLLGSLGYVADTKISDRLAFGSIVEKVYRRENSLPVELHNRVASGLAATEFSGDMFKTAIAGEPFNNPHVLLPSFEETLISLVFHFRDHGLRMAEHQSEDVRRLFERFSPDMATSIMLAKKYHCLIALMMLLEVAELPEQALLVEQSIGRSFKKELLTILGAVEKNGVASRLPLQQYRPAERIWRLMLHLFLARDSLKESALSQVEHILYELKTLHKILRSK